MTMFLRALVTECLKLKRTLALWMVLVTPFVVVLLYTLIGHFGAAQFIARKQDYWPNMMQNATLMWTLLMTPLFITLETSLLAGLEHANNNWKSLLALPVPRWQVYLSKLFVTILLVWSAHVTLVAGIDAAGHLLRWLHPALMPNGTPIGVMARSMAKVSAGVLLALTIQHWVSLRWQSFPAALGFGMSAMIVGFVAVNSKEWGPRVPWSMPAHLIQAHGGDAWKMIVTSLAVLVVLAAAGCWEFSRRDVTN